MSVGRERERVRNGGVWENINVPENHAPVRLISDGTTSGTTVMVGDKFVANVLKARWEINAVNEALLVLTCDLVPAEIEAAGAVIEVVQPPRPRRWWQRWRQ